MILKWATFSATFKLKTVFERSLLKTKISCYTVKSQTETLSMHQFTRNNQIRFCGPKFFHTGLGKNAEKRNEDPVEAYDIKKSLMYYHEFEKWENKNKKTFLDTIRLYKENVKNRAGHVDFIKAALKNMKSYGVHKDLECYKKIIDVLPKGVYVCTNKFLVAGMYYPRQQFVAMELLDQMGDNGVLVDVEIGIILRNIFGKNAIPCQKYKDMFYWMTKWKNKSPFSLPRPLPSDPLLLAKLAIERITSVDLQTEISIFQTDEIKESIDKTWIVSGQSPKQKKLLEKHSVDVPVIVEGGDLIWLMDKTISYFILKADGQPLPFEPPEDTDGEHFAIFFSKGKFAICETEKFFTDILNIKSKFFNPSYTLQENKNHTVHEQDDGVIYGVCATGTSSKDSLLSWVRILQKTGNPILADIPVLFRFKEQEKLPSSVSETIVIR